MLMLAAPPASRLRHLLPALGLARREDGIDDVVASEAILEVRTGALAAFEPFDELDDLMHEAVLVAELQAGHPPVAAVGMISVGDVNALPAALGAYILVIENLETMQIVQVPFERHMLAVDFKRVERLMAAGVTG